jgi:beta-phosphoglucomutase-like phosphatase (HAD superfamily)
MNYKAKYRGVPMNICVGNTTKKYDIFLFDADNTLYDFEKAEESALRTMFEQCGFGYSECILAKYKKINGEAWAAYEKGEQSVSGSVDPNSAKPPSTSFAAHLHPLTP